MVSDSVNRSCGAFKIGSSGPKSLVNSEELLVMGVMTELQSRQKSGNVGDRLDLLVRQWIEKMS